MSTFNVTLGYHFSIGFWARSIIALPAWEVHLKSRLEAHFHRLVFINNFASLSDFPCPHWFEKLSIQKTNLADAALLGAGALAKEGLQDGGLKIED